MTAKFIGAAVVAGVVLVSAGAADRAAARDQIRIVGSSTVFPFAATVAERFGQSSGFPTPVVESTGTGGGLRLFCAGIGEGHPDIANAARRIKQSEFDACAANGITITEVKIGFDGIVLANAIDGPELALTTDQIFLALAAQVPVDGALVDNPYTLWSDIAADLPGEKIEVLGPPPTSGTRDAFVELAMESGAKAFEELVALEKDAFIQVAHTIREDGAFVEAGENDNLIVRKLTSNPAAVGIFGFSFLDNNFDLVKGAMVDGIEPTFENIADGKYNVSRSLYFYVKQEHVGVVPGIEEFIAAFTDDGAWGDDGYLVDKGLIPLVEDERAAVGDAARGLHPLAM